MIRVVVAEDMDSVRKKIERILNSDNEIDVVGSARNGYEAVVQVAINKPDVLITDIEMDDRTDGLKAIVQVLENFPATKVMILTVHEDDEMVFKAFELGVSAYVLKNSSKQDIIKSVKDAYLDTSSFSPEISAKLQSEFKRIRFAEQSFIYCINIISQLTSAEIGLIKYFIQGKSRKEICEIKKVEISTVKTQVNSILKKTNKNSIQELLEVFKTVDILKILADIQEHQ
ncbi:MAG: response regulator transcription factor [Hungatella sp.]